MTDDDEAKRFAVFYRSHYSLILSTCFRRLGNRSAAEDAAAEVFRIVWQRYSKEAPTLPTLYTIARNVVGNEYRRATRSRALQSRLNELSPPHEQESEGVEVREALLSLRPSDRELLYMAYWEDLSAKEIGAIIHVSPGAVWVRLSRAREALREALAIPSPMRSEHHG